MDKLKAIIKKKKYGAYRAQGVDLEKDADRPALPTGKRISKNGNTYYEYRANRIDVKQPPKRYPKLEEGGETDNKIRFDMYGYIDMNNRTQDADEIIRVNSYKEAEEKAKKYLTDNSYELVELYRKGDFVGSIRTKGHFVYSTRYKKEDFASGGMMAKGGKTRQSFMMGDEEVYIADSSIGLKDEVCLFYKKDDSILKCISQNQLKSFIEQGKLKPKMADGGVIYLESVGTYFRPSDLATSSEESFSNEGEIVDLADIDNEEWFNALSEKDRATIEKYKAKGGMMAKGGDLSSIKKKYEENEDENAHSENVVLLAKHFGTKEDLAKAKEILALHEKEGSLSSENGKKRQELHLKLIGKARAEMGKQGIEFEKGGYMAKGGDIGIELMGGQSNSELKPSGYKLISKKGNEIIVSDDGGQTKERYVKNKYGVSGYRLVYNGNDYEFTDSFKEGGYMAKGGKLKVGGDDFSFLLELSDKELSKRLDLVRKQQAINSNQYFEAKEKGNSTSNIEESGKRLQNQETAIIQARIKKMASGGMMADGGELHRSQEKYAYGRYMAMGGAIEHGLKKGDHIMVVRGNMLGIKNEITGEIVTLNIETGERKESKE
jgi:hypothetical protein